MSRRGPASPIQQRNTTTKILLLEDCFVSPFFDPDLGSRLSLESRNSSQAAKEQK